MIDIKWELNGRPLRPGDFKSALERMMFEAVRKNVTERLKGIRSPDGQRLEVTVNGNRLDNLSFNLSGPAELIEEARKRLKE